MQRLIETAFSRHNVIPRTSILLAVCFLAGFMSLNIFSFHQNGKRIELIETINRENLPGELTEIQEMITDMDGLLDATSINPHQKKTALEKKLDALSKKITDLKNLQIEKNGMADLSPNLYRLEETLKEMNGFVSTHHFSNIQENNRFMGIIHDLNNQFFTLGKYLQNYHKIKIDRILMELRTKENELLGISLVFVILGSMMIIFLLIDLVRRGELLERANQAERLKNSFFAMMSHEIRTPINGILGTISLLQGTTLDHHQKHLSDIVQSSAASLLVIVNDVLDYSKIEAGKLELEYSNFYVKDLLESVFELVRPLAEEKRLVLSYHIAENVPPHLHSDPARLRQIILNFLSNAIKFTDKGSVTLNVRQSIHYNSGVTIPMLRWEVVDTGMGISEESKNHLFREFSQVDGSYSRRFAGTGLGLAICRRLAEMMKGQIGVQSEVGKGSAFWFSIPLLHAIDGHLVSQSVTTPERSITPSTLLLVEDNPTNQMIAEAFLKQAGHHVDIVDNGKKAVAAVKTKTYDLVFMDIAMPEMDGFEATKIIRSMPDKKELPIIAMTAHAMRGDREECLAAGMNDYITKPLSRETLLQRVTLWSKQNDMIVKREPMHTHQHNRLSEQYDETEISDMHFNQILQDLGADNLLDFSKRFFEDLQSTGSAMQEAAIAEKWDIVKLHAHSLKSSTLSFGLQRLSAYAATIEQQCKQTGSADPALVCLWPSHAERAVAALNQRLNDLGISS